MSNFKIGILTGCYNTRPELIHQHFFSLARQGQVMKNVIHVVVDDCSTSVDTRSALLFNCDKYKENTILIGLKENVGPGAARNKAIEFLKNSKYGNALEYLCLLDSDDYLEQDSIQVRATILDQELDFIGVYGDKYTAKYGMAIDPLNNEKCFSEITKNLENVPSYDKARLFRECYIPSCSVMFRWKPFIKFIKGFREDVRLCEDYLVWLKLSMLGFFHKINMPIYTQTLHGGNLTTNAEVLKNHWRDLVTTREDFRAWYEENKDVCSI